MSDPAYRLLLQISSSQTAASIALAEMQLITHIAYSPKHTTPTLIDALIHQIPHSNFQHVFLYLISDQQFLDLNYNQLIDWIASNLSSGLYLMTQQTQLLFMHCLLNTQIHSKQSQSLASILIESRCRADLNLCYSLLSTANSTFAQASIQELNNYDFNQLTLLCVRVIKAFVRLPSYLVDEALKFVSNIILPKILSQTDKLNEEWKHILHILFQKVIQILSTQSHTVGNAYRFVGLLLQLYDKLSLSEEDLINLFSLCAANLSKIFPNLAQLKPDSLEKQIEKLHQHFSRKSQLAEVNQIEKKKLDEVNKENRINLNNRLELLRGCSFYLNQFFSFWIEERNHGFAKHILKQLSHQVLHIYKQTGEMLSYCNDRQIFLNFIETYCRQLDIQSVLGVEFCFKDEHLMKQIVENCPKPIYTLNLEKDSAFRTLRQTQLGNVVCCLQETIAKLICEGKLTHFLEMIGENIEMQYDHAFSTVQFQAACNTLAFLFKISHHLAQNSMQLENQSSNSHKSHLSKDEIIEWIKMLINLNESCLPQFRKIIVSKTYQLLTEVFEVILPGNQYLQQVVEEELLSKSFPSQKQALQKLIQFYEKKSSDIFEQGYKNQLESSRFYAQLNGLFQYFNTEFILTNTTVRKHKLLERIYRKIEDRELHLEERTYLWKIAIRVHKIGSQNDEIHVATMKKLFSKRPQILLSRHLAAVASDDLETKNSFSLTIKELKEIEKDFRKNPVFYRGELAIQKSQS